MMFGGLETLPSASSTSSASVRCRTRRSPPVTWASVRSSRGRFQPGNTALAEDESAARGEPLSAASGYEYLRTLAVSRLFLDNVRNVQASWVTQGSKIGQVALAFGANDMGSTMIEENVVAAAGTRFMLARDELVRLITDAGYTPVQRDTLYREVRRF
jgi:cyclic dehypoxanthinyl futalosine synthase